MLTYNEFEKLRDFLYARTGIYIENGKCDSFLKKLEAYLLENKYDNFRLFFYDLKFKDTKHLIQGIINLITVNETYFFREKFQFEVLIEEILPKLHDKRDPDEVIRILCAPSSSGEEVYSIALYLIDENNILAQRDIELVAIDIDSNVIEKAKRGVYNNRSVQFIPKHLKKRFFKAEEGKYFISKTIKDAVNFKVLNVMEKRNMKQLGKFDIIFSRNMLIYFDDQSRKEVGLTFHELLRPEGFIFLGHADKLSDESSLFSMQKLSKSLVYQKV